MTSFTVESFTKGKTDVRNEDLFGWNDQRIVVSDGATDKTGIKYEVNPETGEFKTGGEIASRLVVESALRSDKNGVDLVEEITNTFKDYYRQNHSDALNDSAGRFAASLLVATLLKDRLEIVQVSDSPFRINGSDIYANPIQAEQINIQIRKNYAETTGDIEHSRSAIIDRLNSQHLLQNNINDPLGYGVIDGSNIPRKFINIFNIPVSDVQTLEMTTDGYYGKFPDRVSIEAFEAMVAKIHADDPYKIGRYAATKDSDDRTVLIVRFSNQPNIKSD